MSTGGFEDATQEPYPSDSETASQLDSVFDIGTQFQSPHPYPELDIDLGSQLRDLDRGSRVLGGPFPGGRPAVAPEISSPTASVGRSAKASPSTSSKQNSAPGPGVFDTKNSSGKVTQGPKASPGRDTNLIPIGSFKQTGPIDLTDSDDDVIFVSCQPRTTPASSAPRIKEEPKDQGDTWSRLSAIAAKAGPTSDGVKGSVGPTHGCPGSESGSGESASSCTVERDRTQGVSPVQLNTSHPIREIGRPRFVPKGDVVKKIQANLLKKNMEKATFSTHSGTSTVPAGRPPAGGEPSNGQTGPGKPVSTSGDVPRASTEIIIVDDELENEWMNQDIEEDDDSDA
jgi:hypothetical protein